MNSDGVACFKDNSDFDSYPSGFGELRKASAFASPTDDDDNLVLDEYPACGGLPPISAGYAICLLILLEGIYVLFHVTGVSDDGILGQGLLLWVDTANPLQRMHLTVLEVLGLGDFVAAIGGAAGLYMATTAVDPRLSTATSQLCCFLIGALATWRAVVTLTFGPWVAIVLAYEPRTSEVRRGPLVFATLVYVAISLYVLWNLLPVFRAVAVRSACIQQRLDARNYEEGELLLAEAYRSGLKPTVADENLFLSCLPLETAVAVYALVLGVVLLWWCLLARTIGGWAFMLDVPEVPITYPFEVFVYLVTAVAAFASLIAIMSQGAGGVDTQAMEKADIRGQMAVTYCEELEAESRRNKRRTATLLAFFIVNVVRFGLFMPITGLALLTRNLCGLYVRALSHLSLRRSFLAASSVAAPLHCTRSDFLAVAAVALVFAVDAILVRASFRLWRLYRFAQRDETMASYGSAALAEGRGALASLSGRGETTPSRIFKVAVI